MIAKPVQPQIRQATAQDLEACAAIFTYWIEHSVASFDDRPFEGARAQAWFDAHTSARYPLLVAVTDQVRGWGTLSPWSEKGGYARTVEISVFVAPDCRKQGVGKQLIGALLHKARQVGHRVILARVESTNVASIRAFKRAGFETVGVMHNVGFKFDRWLHIELLEHQLAEA